jgi:hypothetical protein
VRGTHDIPVAPGDQFIGQTNAGASFAFNFLWYDSIGGFISYVNASTVQTAPANAATLRVAAIWAAANRVEDFSCTIVRGTARIDLTKRPVAASTLLMQNNFINLRVVKDDIINQINISTEGILIAGNKIRITGQTTIDNAVITNAMIANLDAAKINTGALSADRIAAGSITSAKLTVANGFITNAMIADATIQSAKIATIDAAKITTGTLQAGLIKAGILSSVDGRFSVNMVTGVATLSAATITGGSVSIGGSTWRTEIAAGELRQYALGNGVFICGLTPFSAGTEYRPTLYVGRDSRVTGFSISHEDSVGNIVNIAQFDKTKIDLIKPVRIEGGISGTGSITITGTLNTNSGQANTFAAVNHYRNVSGFGVAQIKFGCGSITASGNTYGSAALEMGYSGYSTPSARLDVFPSWGAAVMCLRGNGNGSTSGILEMGTTTMWWRGGEIAISSGAEVKSQIAAAPSALEKIARTGIYAYKYTGISGEKKRYRG